MLFATLRPALVGGIGPERRVLVAEIGARPDAEGSCKRGARVGTKRRTMNGSTIPTAAVDPRRNLSAAAHAVLVAAYPVAAYLGLVYLGTRAVAMACVGLMVVRLLVGVGARGREHARALLAQLLPLGAVAGLTLFRGDARYLQALPVVVNAMLLFVFARSLTGPVPIVERFARIQDPDLEPAEVAYCRTVTRVWCGFFVLNGSIAGLLIFAGSLAQWALYTGFLSYLLIGGLFAAEYAVRRLRFRRFGDGPIDQLALSLIGPTSSGAASEPSEGKVASSQRGTSWSNAAEKGSVLGLRFLFLVCNTLGRPAVRVVMRIVALYYVATDSKLRSASRSYHRRLGVPADLGAVYRHVLRFAYCASDRIFLRRRDMQLFELRRTGQEHVDRLMAAGQGAIILGAHFGSFEALRVGAEDDFPLSVVAYFENAQKSNAILKAVDPDFARRVINVEPNSINHVLRIRDRVRNGEMVGILADRLMPGEAGVAVNFLGDAAVFPTGGFELAAVLGCPVLLTFCIGRDPNLYDVHCEVFSEQLELPRFGREQALQEVVQGYAKRLEEYVRLAPDNWFNFYDFWEQSDREARSPGASFRSAEVGNGEDREHGDRHGVPGERQRN